MLLDRKHIRKVARGWNQGGIGRFGLFILTGVVFGIGGLVYGDDGKGFTVESSPTHVEKVKAQEAGVLMAIHVEVGESVQKNKVLGTLDDTRQRHAFEVAKLRSANKSMIQLADAEVDLRKAELQEVNSNSRSGASQVKKAEAQLDVSRAKLAMAHQNYQLTQLDFKMAKEQLEKRQFRSPIDGVVIQILKTEGDSVASGAEVFVIANREKVQLGVSLPAAMAKALGVGATIPVRRQGNDLVQLAKIVSIVPDPKGKKGEQLVNFVVNSPAGLTNPFGVQYDVLMRDNSSAENYAPPPMEASAPVNPPVVDTTPIPTN